MKLEDDGYGKTDYGNVCEDVEEYGQPIIDIGCFRGALFVRVRGPFPVNWVALKYDVEENCRPRCCEKSEKDIKDRLHVRSCGKSFVEYDLEILARVE